MASRFLSPGVYTREQDFTVFASRVGLTRLGLVGKTQRGPAFEPIKVETTDDFLLRFGNTDSSLALPYVAQTFLSQSNELNVTRILGETGFKNSGAWLVNVSGPGYTGDTTVAVLRSKRNQISGEFYFNEETDLQIISRKYSGSVEDQFVTYEKSISDNVENYIFDFTDDTSAVDPITVSVSGSSSANSISVSFNSLSAVTTLDLQNALIENEDFNSFGIQVSGGVGVNLVNAAAPFALIVSDELEGISPMSSFVLSGSTGPLTASTNGLTVSLDETRTDYVVKELTKNPEIVNGDQDIYVERIYPHFLREAVARNEIDTLKVSLTYTEDASYTDYEDKYKNAITPWIVSRVVGSDVKNLFRVQTVSDGDSANSEIKISIQNLDINNNRFDLWVRRYSDTDATASSTLLESFTNLSMNETDINFVGRAIGTTNEDYPRRSGFITIDMADSYPQDSLPAGFRGYEQRTSETDAAGVYYKNTYTSGDSVFRSYLGISELAYTSLTSDKVSFRNSVKNLEKDIYQYNGGVSTGITLSKGFHMENVADSDSFISGDKSSLTAYTNEAGTLIDRSKLKFTVVPAGGFDGWDKYATYQDSYEEFTDAYQSNVKQFKKGIDTFSNVEETDINVFATPGIDFSNNLSLIRYGLEMVETRFDSLYVMDAPRLTVGNVKGTPEQVRAILESTGIDSSYACTYWPWIQIEDVNNSRYTWQPPTLMAVEAFALTDNVANPWFAPAGLNRGRANSTVIRGDIKPNKRMRDTLYEGRINPIATFIQDGVVIFGQKTLQVTPSALDRINVRRLLLQVRRLVSAASVTLIFEQNDQALRDQFLARVEPLLLDIQNKRGLSGFKVVMDDSNNSPETVDRNTLVGKIQLKPTPTAEFIDLTFQVLPTGANFEDF